MIYHPFFYGAVIIYHHGSIQYYVLIHIYHYQVHHLLWDQDDLDVLLLCVVHFYGVETTPLFPDARRLSSMFATFVQIIT